MEVALWIYSIVAGVGIFIGLIMYLDAVTDSCCKTTEKSFRYLVSSVIWPLLLVIEAVKILVRTVTPTKN